MVILFQVWGMQAIAYLAQNNDIASNLKFLAEAMCLLGEAENNSSLPLYYYGYILHISLFLVSFFIFFDVINYND